MALNGNDFLEYLHYSLTLITVGRVNVNQTCDLISEKHLPTLLFNNLVILMFKNKQASTQTNKTFGFEKHVYLASLILFSRGVFFSFQYKSNHCIAGCDEFVLDAIMN